MARIRISDDAIQKPNMDTNSLIQKQHNPSNLSPEQYEAHLGFRLLDKDEIIGTSKDIKEIEFTQLTYLPDWMTFGGGHNPNFTYRTKLSRSELAAARCQTPKASEATQANVDSWLRWIRSEEGNNSLQFDSRFNFGRAAFLAGQRSQAFQVCMFGIPGEEEEVIVFGPEVGMAFARKTWAQGPKPTFWKCQGGDRWEMSDVTHWMPMPRIP